MKIAIISDIHDNLWKLDVVLPCVYECDAMICCGDLCSPFVIDELANGFPRKIHIVFGNNDADLFRITAKTNRYSNVQLYGEFCDIELGGKRFAVNHFDYLARPIAKSQIYDTVCFGHNHEFEITTYGRTLAMNPGCILGAKFGKGKREDTESTFIVYETETNTPAGFKIEADGRTVQAFA